MLKKYSALLEIPLEEVESVRTQIGVKLDEEPALDAMEPDKAGAAVPTTERDPPPASDSDKETQKETMTQTIGQAYTDKDKSRGVSHSLIAAIVSGAVVLTIGSYYFLQETAEEIDAVTLQVERKVEPVAKPAETMPIQNNVSNKQQDNLNAQSANIESTLMFITKSDSVWIRYVTGNTDQEIILMPFNRKKVTFNGQARISVGRAQSVTVTLNGQGIALPKRYGVVKDFSVPSTTTTNSP